MFFHHGVTKLLTHFFTFGRGNLSTASFNSTASSSYASQGTGSWNSLGNMSIAGLNSTAFSPASPRTGLHNTTSSHASQRTDLWIPFFKQAQPAIFRHIASKLKSSEHWVLFSFKPYPQVTPNKSKQYISISN
jgi:hypothetical protein